MVGGSTDTYTVTALDAAQAGKMNTGTLLWAAGFPVPANNGLKSVDANVATNAAAIPVAENLTAEASSPSGARISLAGYRIPSAMQPHLAVGCW